jgi:hypothetical protein
MPTPARPSSTSPPIIIKRWPRQEACGLERQLVRPGRAQEVVGVEELSRANAPPWRTAPARMRSTASRRVAPRRRRCRPRVRPRVGCRRQLGRSPRRGRSALNARVRRRASAAVWSDRGVRRAGRVDEAAHVRDPEVAGDHGDLREGQLDRLAACRHPARASIAAAARPRARLQAHRRAPHQAPRTTPVSACLSGSCCDHRETQGTLIETPPRTRSRLPAAVLWSVGAPVVTMRRAGVERGGSPSSSNGS